MIAMVQQSERSAHTAAYVPSTLATSITMTLKVLEQLHRHGPVYVHVIIALKSLYAHVCTQKFITTVDLECVIPVTHQESWKKHKVKYACTCTCT